MQQILFHISKLCERTNANMKKYVVGFLLLLASVSLSLHAQGNEEIFAKFSSAFDLFKKGSFQNAGSEFASLYETWPGSSLAPDSCFMAAQSYFNAGDFPTSYLFCVQFIQNYSDHPNISDAKFQLGRIFFKTGRFKDAIAAFDDFMNAYPDSQLFSSALFWKAESYYQLGDIARSFPLFKELIEKWPDSDKASLASWRLNVMGLEVREAKFSRLMAYETEKTAQMEIGRVQKEALQEQQYLRAYYFLKMLRARMQYPPQNVSEVDLNLKSRLNKLSVLLEAKKRILDLFLAKIDAYVREIAP